MSRLRKLPAGLVAIGLLVAALATLVGPSGANQSAHYALVRAFDDGTTQIDRWHPETPDKSYYEGHFYSVKAPGLAGLTYPFYVATERTGIVAKADDAGRRIAAQTTPESTTPRALLIRTQRATTWLLGLWAVVLPTAILLLLLRWAADRVAPGYGTLAAVGLGLGTLLLPYGTMLYAHALSAALGFAAFCVLWRERDGPPRLALLAAAGLLSGLAVLAEYPVFLVGAVLGLYAIARDGAWLTRGLAYAGGVAAGVLPLAAFNLVAFGSLTHLSYDDAVAVEGRTGRDVLGLNDEGLFGVTAPDPSAALDLLLAPKGLLAVTPIVAAGVVGLIALARTHQTGRTEARLALGVVGLVFLYVSAYYLPFGGDVPGPRFLVPALPFLALGVAAALRAWPAATLALLAASAVGIGAATLTDPQLVGQDTGTWASKAAAGDLQSTIADGVLDGWLQAIPFLALVLAALAVAVRATPWRPSSTTTLIAAGAVLGGWALVAAVVPPLLDDRSSEALGLVAAATLAGAAALTTAARLGSRAPRAATDS